jgi:hypothetical protein
MEPPLIAASRRLESPGWEYLMFDALQIDLPGDAWPKARELAVEASRTTASRLSASTRRYGPLDYSAHGHMAEAALSQLLGIEYAWELPFPPRSNGPDVAGFEVKSTCWYNTEAQLNWHGGSFWVKGTTEAEEVVFCTLFDSTRHLRVYLDGWLPMPVIRRAAEPVSGKGGWGTSYRVPYARLRSWRTHRELAAAAGR